MPLFLFLFCRPTAVHLGYDRIYQTDKIELAGPCNKFDSLKISPAGALELYMVLVLQSEITIKMILLSLSLFET